ncbi:hypothetical protein LI328DRAFT_125058, partial [Trichoderma asperelloides]
MKVGGKARLDITSAFAYGPRSIPGVIPANSDLIFDVELVNVIPGDRNEGWPDKWFDDVIL